MGTEVRVTREREYLYVSYVGSPRGPSLTTRHNIRRDSNGDEWAMFSEPDQLEELVDLSGDEGFETSTWGMEDDYDNTVRVDTLLSAFGGLRR